MKLSLLCSAALFSLATYAFPAALLKGDISDATLAEITALTEKILENQRQSGHVKRAFNAKAQRIDTTGEHEFKAASSSDLRGPCPGLNVMANHGYLPRNGMATITQLATASNEVFGMGIDLSTFLAVYAAVMSGDLTTVSIGGKPTSNGLVGGILKKTKRGLLGGLNTVTSKLGLGLIGEAQGLSNSHNRFEVDGSPTRDDLYSTGDVDSLNMNYFEELLAMPQGKNGYDMGVMTAFRINRVRHSIATNGHYFAGPVTFFALNPATYQFTYRLYANHTEENPEGFLSAETLMSFHGVTGQPGSLKWTRGTERFPDNWYRRVIGDEYGIPAFTAEAVLLEASNPELYRLGGNTGEPNSFVGVNIDDLTGNVFRADTLLEGNNLMCLALQAALQGSPDVLGGLVGNVLQAVTKLTDALNPIIASLNCPTVTKYDASLFKAFPGAGSAL